MGNVINKKDGPPHSSYPGNNSSSYPGNQGSASSYSHLNPPPPNPNRQQHQHQHQQQRGQQQNNYTGQDAKNCVLLGLYPTCSWDARTVRRLIIEKKIAPIFKGSEEKLSDDLDECPICFLFYPGGLNRSVCCKQQLCTECYLQVKKMTGVSSCPFCNREGYTVVFVGPKTKEEREKEEEEERKVIEAHERMRREEIEEDKRREEERRKKREEEQRRKLEDEERKKLEEEEREKLEKEEATTTTTTEKSESDKDTSSFFNLDGEEEVSNDPTENFMPSPSAKAPTSPFLSYDGPASNALNNLWHQQNTPDLEEFMLNEAIRLSMLEYNNSNKS